MSLARRVLPQEASRRGWCPSLARPMPTGDGLLARVHPPLGILSLAQIRAVAEGARRFGNGHVDVTARGNLQVRGVSAATARSLSVWLDEAGLGDVRDDGGPQRLTLTSPLAGPEILALARAIEVEGRCIAGLPPKTLVAILGAGMSGDGADVVVQPQGKGCSISLAGGSDDVLEVSRAEATQAVIAILRAFAATARRRIHDLSDAERVDVFRAVCGHPSSSLRASAKQSSRRDLSGKGGVSLDCFASLAMTAGDEETVVSLSDWPTGLIEYGGPVVLSVEAPFGRCTADALGHLAETAERAAAHEVRTTPTRGFVVACRDGEATHLASEALSAVGFITRSDDARRAIAACPGAPACASGTTLILDDAAALANAFALFAARGLKAHVSGCAKGCAHPGAADLTLVADHGRYDIVLQGGSRDEPAMRLTFEAALERVRRADPAAPLADAFRP